MTSLFEIAIFFIGFFGSDYLQEIAKDSVWYNIFYAFRFECKVGYKSRWNDDASAFSMMLFKFHFIVIFMYTMIFCIVLWEIPYRYGRLMKTEKELTQEKQKKKKKRDKKRRKTGKTKKKKEGSLFE